MPLSTTMSIVARPVSAGKRTPCMSRALRGERYQMRTAMRAVTNTLEHNGRTKPARDNDRREGAGGTLSVLDRERRIQARAMARHTTKPKEAHDSDASRW